MSSPAVTRPFACFTLDDGYLDNRDHAYPVFQKHGVPFAIYVPTAYADGEGDLWWLVLEAALRKARVVRATLGGIERRFEVASDEAKERAFAEIYWFLRDRPETELRAAVAKIAEDAGYDASGLCRALIMDWDELRALAADPLVTIGAHTRRHFAVSKLSEHEARAEMAESVARIERELGRPCRHFSFPYGDAASAGPRDFSIAAALGLASAVTTHKDVLRGRYAMTGLPRVSLNGDFQQARYVAVMLTGVPFLLADASAWVAARFKRLVRLLQRAVPGNATRPDAAST